MLMMKRRSQLPPLTMPHMNHLKSKVSLSILAGGRCNVYVPIQYENEWAIKMRFTQLQRAVKLFSRNLGEINDALNATMNMLTTTPCSQYS